MTGFVVRVHIFGAQSTKSFASTICPLPNSSEFEGVQIHGPKACIGADKGELVKSNLSCKVHAPVKLLSSKTPCSRAHKLKQWWATFTQIECLAPNQSHAPACQAKPADRNIQGKRGLHIGSFWTSAQPLTCHSNQRKHCTCRENTSLKFTRSTCFLEQ